MNTLVCRKQRERPLKRASRDQGRSPETVYDSAILQSPKLNHRLAGWPQPLVIGQQTARDGNKGKHADRRTADDQAGP